MNEIRVQNTESLLCAIPRQLQCGHWFFRGVRSTDHRLIPSISRQALIRNAANEKARRNREASMLEDFKSRSRSLVDCEPQDDWEWLALAQHHRLPTRLLDWSTSMLTALYFASEKELKDDGSFEEYKYDACALYMAHCKEMTDVKSICESPLECSEVGLVATPQVTSRMTGQSGLFSIQPDPEKPFDEQFEPANQTNQITKIVIPAYVREDLFNILHRVGIRKASIFPDMEGLTAEIRQKNEMGCSTIGRITLTPPDVPNPPNDPVTH